MSPWFAVPGLIAAVFMAACGAGPARDGNAVLIFAAASLSTALDAAVAPCGQAEGVDVRTSYAGTSALARQIEAAAPADIFISADVEWMAYLAERQLVRPETRVDLLGNELVLIAPAGRVPDLVVAHGFGLAAALAGGRLAVANPASVPAGKYARASLQALAVWDSVEAHLATADDVRAALLLVSRGEAPLGIVYRTDAAADPRVAVVGAFPSWSHSAIVYPAALTAGASASAAALFRCLQTPAASAVFERFGFRLIPRSAS